MSLYAAAIADKVAKALYVSAHWADTITEHDADRLPDAEYKRRAGERWDKGNAGWARYQSYPRLADAAREALTPRTVTTAEELDALPLDSVVLDANEFVYEQSAYEEALDIPWWSIPGDPRMYGSRRVALPATVLFEPATS